MAITLREALLSALSTLPGTREFHLHVLVTAPRKHTGLFPFALPRPPRAYLQDILILVSEQAASDAPRHFVTAIEAALYDFTATSCAVLYVAKVDSTGHGAQPSPTSPLVKTLLSFYADRETRPISADHLWIQLFARAQSQYLFPNSADFAGKKWLSDVKLCVWWRRILGEVADGLALKGQTKRTELYYLLPGMREGEAIVALGIPTQRWNYGHPYTQKEIPLPCPPPPPEGTPNLGHYIPYFEDDPKTRFMEEIACTTDKAAPESPQRKRPRLTSSSATEIHDAVASLPEKEAKEGKPRGELSMVSPDEFWERMWFRQECIAGAMTGFFAVGLSSGPCRPSKTKEGEGPQGPWPLAPQPGQVSSHLVKRVLSVLMNGIEFSTVERSAWATSLLEGTIKGLCDTLSVPPPVVSLSAGREKTPERETAGLLAPPRTPPRSTRAGIHTLMDASPNPFPEPEASLETYSSHIYGSISVNNPDAPPKVAAVQVPVVVKVLTARKKVKRPAPP